MKLTDISKLYFGNDEVVALYKGGNLIYQKPADAPANLLKVKYSTPGSYVLRINGVEKTVTTDDEGYYSEIVEEPLTSCYQMFKETSMFTSKSVEEVISLPDMSQVTDMSDMFYNCKKLTNFDFSKYNLSNVTNVSYMFNGCTNLTSVKIAGLTDISDVSYMFSQCKNITAIDLSGLKLNVSLLAFAIIDNCANLTSVNLGDSLDLSDISSFMPNYLINNCPKLTTVTGSVIVGGELNLTGSPLSNSSAMVFINGLMPTTKSPAITFSSVTYDTLTDDQIAIATAKGWSVAYA